MFRKTLVVLLALVLLPSLTGWAGDRCCPTGEAACASPCGDGHAVRGGPAPGGHEDADPGHQQALCGCACHALCTSAAPASLDAPTLQGRTEPMRHPDLSKAHRTAVFRPPIA
jgi:hypothetical protein